jgi:hypothetical protein
MSAFFLTLDRKKTTNHQHGFGKSSVQCSADSFVVYQFLVLRMIFVFRIATFAKPGTVLIHEKS